VPTPSPVCVPTLARQPCNLISTGTALPAREAPSSPGSEEHSLLAGRDDAACNLHHKAAVRAQVCMRVLANGCGGWMRGACPARESGWLAQCIAWPAYLEEPIGAVRHGHHHALDVV